MMLRLLRLMALLVLLFLIIIIIAIPTTNTGLQQIVAVVEKMLPELHIGHINGTLLDHIEIVDFSYRNKKIFLNAKRIALDWQVFALLHTRLQVNNLVGDDVALYVL